MEKKITKEEYQQALLLIKSYEKQLEKEKLSIYKGCTVNDIINNTCKHYYYDATAFWVTKGKTIPDRDPDGMIVDKGAYFVIVGNTSVYDNYEKAYKALIAGFKRRKLIK